jgi:hypothetical protein
MKVAASFAATFIAVRRTKRFNRRLQAAIQSLGYGLKVSSSQNGESPLHGFRHLGLVPRSRKV